MSQLPSIGKQRATWAKFLEDARAAPLRTYDGRVLTDRQLLWFVRNKFWTFFNESGLPFLEPWPPDWDRKPADAFMPSYFTHDPRPRQRFPVNPSTNNGGSLRNRQANIDGRVEFSPNVARHSHFTVQDNATLSPSTESKDPGGSTNSQMNSAPHILVYEPLTSCPPLVHMEQSIIDHSTRELLPPSFLHTNHHSPQYPAPVVLSNRASQSILSHQDLPYTSQSSIGGVQANVSSTEPSNSLLTTEVYNPSSRVPHPIFPEHQRHTVADNIPTLQAKISTSNEVFNQSLPEGPEGTEKNERENQGSEFSFGEAEIQVARVYSSNDTNKLNDFNAASAQRPLLTEPLLIVDDPIMTLPRRCSARPSTETSGPRQRSVPNFSRPLPAPLTAMKHSLTTNTTNYHSDPPHTRNLKCTYCRRSDHALEQCRACTYCAGKSPIFPNHELFECPMYEVYEPFAYSGAFIAHCMRQRFVPPDPSHGTRLEASVGLPTKCFKRSV